MDLCEAIEIICDDYCKYPDIESGNRLADICDKCPMNKCEDLRWADCKTENSSEKPNNCEECKHWNDTEDDCADRHGCRTTTEDWQDWKDKMWSEAVVTEPTTEDCSTVKPQNYCDDCLYCDTCDSKEFFYACTSKATISKMEQVDEPQTCSVNGRPYTDCCNCEYFKCTADEPKK